MLALALALAAAPVDLARLREAALQDDVALKLVEDLTTEVGARPGGTEAEARGRAWAIRRLKALGFRNVREEPFRMPVWVRGAERAEVLGPARQTLVVAALGNSGSTGPQGIEAEVVGFETLVALEAAPADAVRGKIVFVSHGMRPTQDGSSYGAFGPVRRQGPSIASAKGAAAVLIRSIGTDYHRNPHTGVQTWAAGVRPIPAGALSIPDAEQVQRLLKRGPLRVRLVLESRMLADQPSGNVIAEVPGRDPGAGIVLAGCHLDSWDLGTGAIDDAAGCGIVAAAAKRVMDAGRPRRTIRVVFFGAEEVGILGGAAYRDRHRAEKHAVVAESDFGADRVWKLSSRVTADALPMVERMAAALAPLGVARGDNRATAGSDIGPLGAIGVPVLALSQDGTRYFDYHHTPDDTFDKIDPAQLRQNVAAWTVVLAEAANAAEESGTVAVE